MTTPELGSNPTPQQAAETLLKFFDSGEGQALKLRSEASALQLKAAALLDEADRIEHVERLKAVAAKLDEQREAEAQAERELEAAVTAAITEARRAEDVAREAAENHRQLADQERRGQRANASPAEQTENLLKVRAAADVAARLQAGAEGAQASRVAMERRLGEARQRTAECERTCEVAHALAENPPTVPVSAATALLDGVRRMTLGQELSDSARGTVELLVTELGRRLGVDKVIRNEARKAWEQEQRERQDNLLLPAKGHPLRPANPGVQAIPVLPTA